MNTKTISLPNWREVEGLHFPSTSHESSTTDVVIVGAGPVGLTLAIDLAQRGVPSIVLNKINCLSVGSRAICWSRRTLDIFNRLGIADTMRTIGAQWQVGRVFYQQKEIYNRPLTAEIFPENPFFVNFQQSLCEYLLLEEVKKYPEIELRWGNEAIEVDKDKNILSVRCPNGVYTINSRYIAACDGSKSTLRELLHVPFQGRSFNDRFLIADIEMRGDFPAERWFWFEPPFHQGQSTLLHKQSQNIWRVDFQLDSQSGVSTEQLKKDVEPELVRKRIRALLGEDGPDFDIVWCSVYFFSCRRIERFTHGNIFFVGDSAHVVSPFGARGGNGGVQDADNLSWKLAEVIHKRAKESLLTTYDEERCLASDENIQQSSRTTDFMTPKTAKSKRIRDCVLQLAEYYDFAIPLINSGRMSLPASYAGLSLAQGLPDAGKQLRAGDPAIDIPIICASDNTRSYLFRHIKRFTLISYNRPQPIIPEQLNFDILTIYDNANDSTSTADWIDYDKMISDYYLDNRGGYIVIRPDQHILGIWQSDDASEAINAIHTIIN